MKSFTPQYLSNLQIPQKLTKLLVEFGMYKGKQALFRQQSPQVLKNLKQVAIIQSTESSNRIEGIEADYERIKAIVENVSEPQNRSEDEIAGYRDVLNTIHASAVNIPFTTNVILQFHRDLLKYSATGHGGNWKSTSNEISEYLPDGTKRIRFQPVEPFLTDEYMRQLETGFHTAVKESDLDPLILIHLYVLDFLCIHPFLDGNGRISRLIVVLLLYHFGYDVCQYISLERLIEKTKESYYETLQSSSQGWHDGQHNVWPWLEYSLGVILAAYREFETRVERVSAVPGAKSDMVMQAIENYFGDFSVSDVKKACPSVSTDWIRETLSDLKKQGKVTPIGHGRYAKWRKV